MSYSPSDPVEFDAAIDKQVDRIISNMSEKNKAKLVLFANDKYDPCVCGSGKQFRWCCYRDIWAQAKGRKRD